MPRGLIFVLLTVFIDTVGFGIVYPTLPQLIMQLTGEDLSAHLVYGAVVSAAYAALAGSTAGAPSTRQLLGGPEGK